MKFLNVFLAEDNRGDVVLIREALEQHQLEHELHVVRDGAQAIEFLERMGKVGGAPCPDVILLDLNLPRADGPQILSEFRKHPECARTPVIIVSSSDAPRDRARAAELGVNRYFRKPSEFDAYMSLGAVVREVLEDSAH